jgi:predicted nucleic acid-binding protein
MTRPNYSWDATVFLAWLVEEASAPLLDIDAVVGEIDDDKAVLIVSVTAYSEILEAKNEPEKMAKFRAFLKRSNVVVADSTVAIAEKAGQIRSKGLAKGRKIKTPDATYLAVAILFKADVLHSLDDDMLHLNESPIVDGLKITRPKPISGQTSLFNPGASSSAPEQPS